MAPARQGIALFTFEQDKIRLQYLACNKDGISSVGDDTHRLTARTFEVPPCADALWDPRSSCYRLLLAQPKNDHTMYAPQFLLSLGDSMGLSVIPELPSSSVMLYPNQCSIINVDNRLSTTIRYGGKDYEQGENATFCMQDEAGSGPLEEPRFSVKPFLIEGNGLESKYYNTPVQFLTMSGGTHVFGVKFTEAGQSIILYSMSLEDFNKLDSDKDKTHAWSSVAIDVGPGRQVGGGSAIIVQGTDPKTDPRLYFFFIDADSNKNELWSCWIPLQGTSGQLGALDVPPGTGTFAAKEPQRLQDLFNAEDQGRGPWVADPLYPVKALICNGFVVLFYVNKTTFIHYSAAAINPDGSFAKPDSTTSMTLNEIFVDSGHGRLLAACTVPSDLCDGL